MKKKAARTQSLKKKRPAKGGHRISATEFTRLTANLAEAQETLEAIRNGEVDAVVVSGPRGNQIYSLTSAEQPYRVYVEQMQEGAVTVSADGLILYCNQRFADMMQTPLERVIGSELSTYLGKEPWNKISKIFKQGNVAKHDCVVNCITGVKMPLNLTASRFLLENQDVMCLVVTDLTDQKKHEEERLARELAEKASLAKDDFLAALSHELRTPLTPVLITTNALEQNTATPPEVRASLKLIRRNVELEARLIDDLLDLTRIARGKMELHAKNLDFHAIIRRAVEICRPDITAKSQKIAWELQAQEHQGACDSVRIQQAVWNLVRNAVKFTPQNGTITIHTANLAPGRISIEVSDTGIGFDAKSADKLFQPFEQGGRHITRQYGGLGLGLAITRSIVEAHGGAIQASSAGIGKGATFWFEMPLQSAKVAPEKQSSSPTNKNRAAGGKHILLVEDHEDTRVTLESLLQRNNHQVKAAASAEEALRLAAENTFDLVISDIGLPDQSGLSLMEQLRDQFGLKGIGLSGYGMEEDVAKSNSAGFVRHLTKPIRFDRLRDAIAELNT